MNDLKLFENPKFGKVRTITEDGKILFCGSDVAKTLGYKRPADAITAHCKGSVIYRLPTNGGEQNIKFITEGDVIRLVARSPLPEAAKVESWIFDEVVPSVLHHGAYMTPDTLDRMIESPEFGIRLLTELKEERDKRRKVEAKNVALEAENEQQRQIIADFEPIKRYVDTILESPGAMATSQIAADYDMSARKLNKILHEEGVQYSVNGQWLLYRKHMGQGYTKSKTFSFERSDGRKDAKTQTYWTQKGRLWLNEILNRRGIYAIMDRGAVS